MTVKLLARLAAAAAVSAVCAGSALAQTDVKFALDWKFEGPSAPYFVAIDKGYYKAEGTQRDRRYRTRARSRALPASPPAPIRSASSTSTRWLQVPRPESGQEGHGRDDGL